MRWTAIALLFCLPVFADPETKPTYATLKADSSKGKELKKGQDLVKKYLLAEWELDIGKKGASLTKVERARAKWRDWLGGTEERLGVDFYSHPRIAIAMIIESREPMLKRGVKLKRGMIDAGSKPAPGYSRGDIAYNVLVPKSYQGASDTLFPLVVALHGRAINLRHPAVKKNQAERSRIVLWNNWGGSGKETQQDAIVLAPTGRPDGFVYNEGDDFVRQSLFLGAGVGCTDYQVDSQRIFVEVYGDTVADAVELSSFFAGIILRDREDAKEPPVSVEHLAIFENLNGRPFYYVADDAKWAKVGKPTADALTKIYTALGKIDNLTIERVKRDANSALKANPEKIAKFLKARIPDAQRELSWLFWRPSMTGPMPLLLSRAGYDYDDSEKIAKLPIREKCGFIKMKAAVANEMVGDKNTPINVIELEIYEAEGAKLFLYEPLVDLDLPITVKVNGSVVIDKQMVKRDWNLFELFCMSRKIFTFPVVAQIDFKFPYKPRIEPEKKEEEKPDDKKGEEGKEAATTEK
ncbi:MAG: hypothetical protein ACYS0E_00835 [Planctomycetota bacterium]